MEPLPGRKENIHAKNRIKDSDEWTKIYGKDENEEKQIKFGKIAAFQEWDDTWKS